jgi:hypothetical protein
MNFGIYGVNGDMAAAKVVFLFKFVSCCKAMCFDIFIPFFAFTQNAESKSFLGYFGSFNIIKSMGSWCLFLPC